MNRATSLRERLLRLRQIEHRVAALRQAQADAEFATIQEMASRLKRLRASLSPATGTLDGTVLKIQAEMADRLNRATDQIADPLERARAQRAQLHEARARARQREKNAVEMLDRAHRSDERQSELRMAAHGQRRRRMRGDMQP